MKRTEKRQALATRPPANHLIQVHPLPDTDDEILSIAFHLLHQFAETQGKQPPGFSLDAARFLANHDWVTADLARRVWDAVAKNCGSLITAADLGEV